MSFVFVFSFVFVLVLVFGFVLVLCLTGVYRITAVFMTPSRLATVPSDMTYPELRLLHVAGEALMPSLAKVWAKRVNLMVNAYGPTEVTIIATVSPSECVGFSG